jgi:ribosomal protein L7/L12
MNKEQLIEAISSMTVLELADLVKALEEKFGVSAAAPMAVAAAPVAAVLLLKKNKPNSMSFLKLLATKRSTLSKLFAK